MDSELLLKFIEYFSDYLSALSRTLLRFFLTTFIETAVYRQILTIEESYVSATSRRHCQGKLKLNMRFNFNFSFP